MLLKAVIDLEVVVYAVVFIALLAKVALMMRAGVSRRLWLRRLGWLIAGAAIFVAALYAKWPIQVAVGLAAICLTASSLGLSVRMNAKTSGPNDMPRYQG